jgi:hypothetical protein
MYPIRTRAERARLHLAMLDALPETPFAEAFAEAVSWAETGGIADLPTLLNLADAIDHHVYQAVYHSDSQFAEIDADELRAELGAPTVNLALKLAGFSARQRGNKMYWSNAPSNEQTIAVELPANLSESRIIQL